MAAADAATEAAVKLAGELRAKGKRAEVKVRLRVCAGCVCVLGGV